MNWDRIIIWLLGGFVVLLTAFSVLLGGGMLAIALGDDLGGQILNRLAIASLLSLVIDAILLLLVVAVRTVSKPPL